MFNIELKTFGPLFPKPPTPILLINELDRDLRPPNTPMKFDLNRT